ncbi:MAG: alanine--glyoxylate aminotransferase family protein [Stigonema ocellatum SAG 48.90 = DSM 106950]|nr:alanine--glyoxylate aminotransferase family protein [Stigonema ocellatum SAG 48.90 = DSM 106950]
MMLMTPGPVSVSQKILDAVASPVIFHRAEDFAVLYQEVSQGLTEQFRGSDKHISLLFSGSGTLANEIILSSIFHENDKVLVVSNGDYGERIAKILMMHEVPMLHIQLEWYSIIDPMLIREQLQTEGITAVAMVALETSTGMVNPVKEIGQLIGEYQDQKITFFVDAVSAFGSEDIDVTRDNISYITSVPNKALEGLSGISFACVNLEDYESRALLVKPQSFYMDLSKYIEFSREFYTPTTPSISNFLPLKLSVELLAEETIEQRRLRYEKLRDYLIQGFSKYGFLPIIPESKYRAAAVVAFQVPSEVDADALRKYLYQNGIVVWSPKHYLYRQTIRVMIISVMGTVRQSHIDQLFELVQTYSNPK